MKKKMLATVTAGLVLSGAGAGVAAAMAPAAGAATPATATLTAATPSTASGQQALRRWVRNHRREIARHVVVISAKQIGITPQQLVADLRSGKSIAEVAGSKTAKVENALVTAADARLQKAVDNHRLTAAQAAKIKAALPGFVDKVVDHVFGQHASAS